MQLATKNNVITIRLDATARSTLDWTEALNEAAASIESGHKILWILDGGLFDSLDFPVSNNAQFLTLGLAVDHFQSTVWERFHSDSVGCCLYSGEGDLSELFIGDEELQETWKNDESPESYPLFCRDVAIQYLRLLADRLHSAVPLFALVDVQAVTSPVLKAQLLDRSVWDPFTVIAKGASSWQPSPWNHDEGAVPSVGLCLSQGIGMDTLDIALSAMHEDGIPYRVIPEEYLISEWSGLDVLLVVPSALGDQGLRKLQGFCAAGGAIVTVGETIDVAHYQTFRDWQISGYQEIT